MKRDRCQVDGEMLRKLENRLEAERTAGIPPVPEKLLPEHIKELLEERRNGKMRRAKLYMAKARAAWLVQGGLAVTMAAVLFVLLLPAKKSGSNLDQFAGSAVMTAETIPASAHSNIADGIQGQENTAVRTEEMYDDAALAENGMDEAMSEINEEETNNPEKADRTETAVREGFKRSEKASRPRDFKIREYMAR